MGKKIFLINGSPHPGGNSDFITWFISSRLKVDKIFYVREFKIEYCHGCNFCKKSGMCLYHQDDFLKIIKEISNEKVVFIYPVYFGSLPAVFKGFLDRFQLYYNTGIEISFDALLVSVNGNSKINTECPFIPVKYIASFTEINIVDSILISGIEEHKDFISLEKRKQLKRILDHIS